MVARKKVEGSPEGQVINDMPAPVTEVISVTTRPEATIAPNPTPVSEPQATYQEEIPQQDMGLPTGQEPTQELTTEELKQQLETERQRVRDTQKMGHSATAEAAALRKLMSQILISQQTTSPPPISQPKVDEYGNLVPPDPAEVIRQEFAIRDIREEKKRVDEFIGKTPDYFELYPEMDMTSRQFGIDITKHPDGAAAGLKALYDFVKQQKIINDYKTNVEAVNARTQSNMANFTNKPTFVKPTAPVATATMPDFNGINPTTGKIWTSKDMTQYFEKNAPHLIRKG